MLLLLVWIILISGINCAPCDGENECKSIVSTTASTPVTDYRLVYEDEYTESEEDRLREWIKEINDMRNRPLILPERNNNFAFGKNYWLNRKFNPLYIIGLAIAGFVIGGMFAQFRRMCKKKTQTITSNPEGGMCLVPGSQPTRPNPHQIV